MAPIKDIFFPDNRLFYRLLILYAFLTPLSIAFTNILFGLITVYLFYVLLKGKPAQQFKSLKKPEKCFIFIGILIFLIYAAGIINSNSYLQGAENAGRQISFLVFPALFMMHKPLKIQKVQTVFLAFIVGNLTAVVLNLFISAHSYFLTENSNSEVFFYIEFSRFRHPGFFANYIVVSIALLFYFYNTEGAKRLKHKKLFIGLSFAVFTLAVFLISSRTGILLYAVIIFLFGVYLFFSSDNLKVKIIIIAITTPVIFGLSLNPRVGLVFDVTAEIMQAETYSDFADKDTRLVLWTSAAEVIQDNPWTGVGTDNIAKEMYAIHGIEEYKDLPAHNQFLSMFAAFGILGFLIICSLFIVLYWLAFKRRSLVLMLITTIFIICFQFEAFMDQTAGSFFIPFITAMPIFLENHGK